MIQALFMQLSTPLHNVGTLFREIDQSTVDAEDLYKLLKTETKVKDSDDAQEFELKDGTIEIKNIKFNQNQEQPLFEDFSLKIEPGTSNAIVGPSGFGKTTLFNLLLRIYDPVSGEVCIDGQDLKSVKLESLRKHISVVP